MLESKDIELFENIKVDLMNLYVGKYSFKLNSSDVYSQILGYLKTKRLDNKFIFWIHEKYNIPYTETSIIPYDTKYEYERSLREAYSLQQKPITINCSPKFHNSKIIITEYTSDLCEKIIEHGRQGHFIETFSGAYNVCSDKMGDWINKKDDNRYDEFRSAVKISQSATLHYWNCELINAVKNYKDLGSLIPSLRGILSDIMKTTPKGLRDLQFDNLIAPDTPEERKTKNKSDELKKLQSAFMGE